MAVSLPHRDAISQARIRPVLKRVRTRPFNIECSVPTPKQVTISLSDVSTFSISQSGHTLVLDEDSIQCVDHPIEDYQPLPLSNEVTELISEEFEEIPEQYTPNEEEEQFQSKEKEEEEVEEVVEVDRGEEEDKSEVVEYVDEEPSNTPMFPAPIAIEEPSNNTPIFPAPIILDELQDD